MPIAIGSTPISSGMKTSLAFRPDPTASAMKAIWKMPVNNRLWQSASGGSLVEPAVHGDDLVGSIGEKIYT